MAYAAYRDSSNSLNSDFAPAQPPRPRQLMVLDIRIPSCEAFKVRRLLAGVGNAGVLRCIPRLRDRAVTLELQIPAEGVENVMHLLMMAVPDGEFGSLSSWRGYLCTHGFTHGF